MKLQKITGLSNDDPIHRYLGLVDKFFGDCDWNNLELSKTELQEAFFKFLKHPVDTIVEENDFDLFEEYLQENEPLFAGLVDKLRRHKFSVGMDNQGLRMVLMFIVANVKELSKSSKHRSLNAGWKPS